MKIINQTRAARIASQAQFANSFFSRMKGLLGRRRLAEGEGLWITQCNSIHMFFMRFPLDVIFINKEGKVVGLVSGIQPNRLSRIFWSARSAIEVASGTIEKTQTQIGDIILLEDA